MAANPISYELTVSKLAGKIDTTEKGAANGVATLDVGGKVPVSQLPSSLQHDLGYYATPLALTIAHPTASAGDYAVVGSTDTVWLWDVDTSAWVDSGLTSGVTGVKGQQEVAYRTGNVNLTGANILAVISESAYLLLTDPQRGILQYLVDVG